MGVLFRPRQLLGRFGAEAGPSPISASNWSHFFGSRLPAGHRGSWPGWPAFPFPGPPRNPGNSQNPSRGPKKRLSRVFLSPEALGFIFPLSAYARDMISMRSATWTVAIVELVMSCVTIVSSLAIVSAEFNSVTMNGNPFKPSIPAVGACLMSFCLVLTIIWAMFGLSGQKPSMLLPHIICSMVALVFHATLSTYWLKEWIRQEKAVNGDWLISLVVSSLFQCALFSAILVECRCYRRMD
ncbi:unnamed protein product [Bursaphelenchus xylophilus]|uniref:(pine wood nematode) hypothetical protein n=1 Tax=Bursaphelenchus xylophilus TaxID=6326 RepID=A0A1I7RQ83_BURXY|nr:unnamed protein product [Bursaphelenchus xylophilus]CAG9097302.1 unnamed protein product [Bursaphelenchus xylophilus]